MRLLTRVHGGETDSASQYAVVPVDRPFATRSLAWRTLVQRCKTADPQFYRVTFWACPVAWRGADAWTRLSQGTARPSGSGPEVDDVIARLIGEEAFMHVTDGTIVQLAEAALIPGSLLDAIECDMVDVTEDGLRFKSYPKHTDQPQETELIGWHWFEQVAAQPSRAT